MGKEKVNMCVFILLSLFILLNSTIIALDMIVGGEGSRFVIEPIRFIKNPLVRMLITSRGYEFIERDPTDNPYKNNTITFKSESGEKLFSFNTLFPIRFMETCNGKVYTLEEELYPNHAMIVAQLEGDLAKGEKKKYYSNYVEWTRYYIREYDVETFEGKTLYELPKIQGLPESGDFPIGFSSSNDSIYLFYQDFLDNSYTYYNLRIDQYSLGANSSEKQIYIPNFGYEFKPRQFFIKDNNLFIIRTLKEYDFTKEPGIYDLVKIDLETRNSEVIFSGENLLNCAIDESRGFLFYINHIMPIGGPEKYYLNRLPLSNLNGQPETEIFPFHFPLGFIWDNNQKIYFTYLLENEPLNENFYEGGLIAIKLMNIQ